MHVPGLKSAVLNPSSALELQAQFEFDAEVFQCDTNKFHSVKTALWNAEQYSLVDAQWDDKS